MKMQLAVCCLAALVAVTLAAPFGESARKFTIHKSNSYQYSDIFVSLISGFENTEFQNLNSSISGELRNFLWHCF